MKQLFTEEDIEVLSRNIYTRMVSQYVIKFTDAFKDDFWRLYMTEMPINEIFRTLGYDPELLGVKRTEGFVYNLRRARLTPEQRSESIRLHGTQATPAHIDYSEMRTQEAFHAMDAELKYLRQEVSYLKKIFLSVSRDLEKHSK